jgi:hypothetical protein
MRRWVISSALLANVLASGVVLLVLLYRGGWGNAVELSAVVAEILVLAAVAFVLTLLLVPVLGISFWASDRGTRRLEARLAAPPPEPPHDGPVA